MGKSSIELTLKQLIALGIIKLKKRRRRKRVRAYEQISENPRTPMNETASSVVLGPKGYSTPFYLPTLQPNSDSLRLRDDNQNLNTRLLEYQQQLAISNQEANDFQNKTKAAIYHVLNSMSNQNTIGYTDTDDAGAFGATAGSDAFKSMRSDEEDSGPQVDEIDDEYPVTSEPVISSPSKQPSVYSQLVYGSIKQAAGGGLTPNQPIRQSEKPPSGEVDFVPKTRGKASRAELESWREWYQRLADENADDAILASTKRTEIEAAIIKILVQRYRRLGGDNNLVLKSKDSKEVAREVKRLEKLNQIFD
jgi:hypothetical protein